MRFSRLPSRCLRRPVRAVLTLSSACCLAACGPGEGSERSDLTIDPDSLDDRRAALEERYRRVPVRETYGGLEGRLVDAGLVDIRAMDSTLRVELAYATPHNFLDTPVYGGLTRAYLRIEAAAMLSLAQDELRRRHPEYRLMVYDAARPVDVQRRMWELVRGRGEQRYVADPEVGSLHNWGAAVDLTIAGADGRSLDMGTPFDHFGPRAQPRHEARLLATGALTREQVTNRRLLRSVMESVGFAGIPSEWWHFNAFSLEHCRREFELIE